MTEKIVYLHGLFGSPLDFEAMQMHLGGIALELPGHGLKTGERFDFLDDLLKLLKPYTPCILVGYSLGGRLSIYLQNKYPDLFPKILCLGSHIGQEDNDALRKAWEDTWIERLQNLPKEAVINLWYAQPLFDSFRKHPEFEKVLSRRLKVNPNSIAKIMDQTRRSCLQAPLPSLGKAYFLVGEQDLKVLNLYQRLLPKEQYFVIPGSGHCLHIENPILCSEKILSCLGEQNANRRDSYSAMAKSM